MRLRTVYRFLIFPYTLMLLYFMFLGFGRTVMDDNIVRVKPVYSTFLFVYQKFLQQDFRTIWINLVGNIVMFIPFGFLGWVFPKLSNLSQLMAAFLTAIFCAEGLQYFTRLGIFELDDIILNSIGVLLGFWMFQKLNKTEVANV